jgi:hypothetical protein
MQLQKKYPGIKKIGSSLISFVLFRVDLTKVKFREPRDCEAMIYLECSYIIMDTLSCLSPGTKIHDFPPLLRGLMLFSGFSNCDLNKNLLK